MGKDPYTVAQSQLVKAKQLFKARQFKKSGKIFHKVGNSFLKLSKFEEAKDCFLHGVICFTELSKFDSVIELFRLASEAALYKEDYTKANQIYKEAINYIPKLKNMGAKNSDYILFSVLSYLCTYVKGSPEDGLGYIKRMRSKIDNDFFKESSLVKLVTELTLTLRDNNRNYIDKIKKSIDSYKLRPSEVELLKTALFLTDIILSASFSFKLDKEVYTTKDVMNLKLEFDTKALPSITSDSFYNYSIETFAITKILMRVSDNLTTSTKPVLPFKIELGGIIPLEFILKPHFQLDEPKIGPLILTCEINDNLILNYETSSITPKLISPPASLEASIKNLRPPLIDQTFPLEIIIENLSDGEALDVKIDVEFPEKLKIMRGTTNKQIYSLRKNENLTWEVNLKPIEAGDYIIKININFTDPDQNSIEETKEFPFAVKL
jgi:tetratricopeptide (TPR) repeat protein